MLIGFIGTTHLGLNTAVGYLSKGFKIRYLVEDEDKRERWSQGEFGIKEPSLLSSSNSFVKTFNLCPTGASSVKVM